MWELRENPKRRKNQICYEILSELGDIVLFKTISKFKNYDKIERKLKNNELLAEVPAEIIIM